MTRPTSGSGKSRHVLTASASAISGFRPEAHSGGRGPDSLSPPEWLRRFPPGEVLDPVHPGMLRLTSNPKEAITSQK